jgi:hypothetical protein
LFNASSAAAPTISTTNSAVSPLLPKTSPNNTSTHPFILAGVTGTIPGILAFIIVFSILKRDQYGQRLLVKGIRSAYWKLRHHHRQELSEDSSSRYKAELDGKAVAPTELDGEAEVRELVAASRPVELVGDSIPRVVEMGPHL